MNIFVVFYSIGLIIMGLYVFMVLTFSKNVRLGHKYLGLYVLMLVSNAIFLFLYETRLLYDYPHYAKVTSPILLIGIPSVILSIKKILKDESKTKKKELLLFVPALIEIVRLSPFYFQSSEMKIEWIDSVFANPHNIILMQGKALYSGHLTFIFNTLYYIVLLIYIFRVIRNFTSNQGVLSEGNKESMHLNYAKTFFILLVGSFLVYVLLGLTSYFYPTMAYYLSFSIVIPLSVVLFYLLSKPSILFGLEIESLQTKSDVAASTFRQVSMPYSQLHVKMTADKLPNSKAMMAADNINHLKQIELSLSKTGLHLEPGFTIDDLSREVNLPVRNIRESVFAVTRMNFKQYINHLKIGYFVSKLKSDPKWRQYKIEAISNMLGYQSPTSFYNSFKNIHGCTPKEFINRNFLN